MKLLVWLALSLSVAAPLNAADEIAASRRQDLQDLLTQDCGSCHGSTLRGGLGPALLPAELKGRSADDLATIILDGRPGTAMPPWRPLLTLPEAQWMAERLLEGIRE
ncbi:MAG TPA: cytochrome c [Gammaproteobacteria bacterium]|nr:cytochrome c [Gammaproteobacteria bacterium]